MNTLYVKFLDTEYDGLDGRYLDVMELCCHMHGVIESWQYDAVIPWDVLEEIADDHMHSMHYP
jgi:hypothetical protein